MFNGWLGVFVSTAKQKYLVRPCFMPYAADGRTHSEDLLRQTHTSATYCTRQHYYTLSPH